MVSFSNFAHFLGEVRRLTFLWKYVLSLFVAQNVDFVLGISAWWWYSK